MIAKFWLEPDIRLAENHGFSAHHLSEIWSVIRDHHNLLEEKWHEYFGN